MRRYLHIIFPSVLLAGFFMMLTPGRALVDRALFPDEASLEEGLNQSIALVHDTADVATDAHPELVFAADARHGASENADPAQAGELSNNYALSDHSNQARYPGYNDCDAWHNAFDDGWSASYALVADSPRLGYGQRRRIVGAVREHWESRGYVIETPSPGAGDPSLMGFRAETEVGHIAFGIDLDRDTITFRALTNCLPPE